MTLINRLQSIIILFSALMGLTLGIFTPIGNVPIFFVEIFLMLLLFILFLAVDMKQFKKATLNVKYTGTSLFINFIITPIVAYILATVFFEDSLAIRMGLVMLLVTPCTDWYLVFTKLSGGNVEVNMSILPLNLILQVVLLPIYLLIFFGSVIDIKLDDIIGSIALVLLVPFISSMIFRVFTKDKSKIKEIILNKSDNLQLLFLCLAVITMFASEGENLFNNYLLLLKLFIPLVCFFIITFFIARLAGKALNFSRQDLISLHFTTLARNSPLALAIAVSAFAAEPLISLSLIVGPLLELPILSIISGILKKNIFDDAKATPN